MCYATQVEEVSNNVSKDRAQKRIEMSSVFSKYPAQKHSTSSYSWMGVKDIYFYSMHEETK